MPKRKPKQKPKPSKQSDRLGNDILEFGILVVASMGVGGALFALIYLAHINGAI